MLNKLFTVNNQPTKYKSKKEIAVSYGITVRMLRKELLELKVFKNDYYDARRLFSPSDLKKIIDKLGEPEL